MSFRPKLARYNSVCCEQVMPVPVIPICAISLCLPRPILELQTPCCPPPPEPLPYPIPPPPSESPCPPSVVQLEIISYPPSQTPPVGAILTNTTGSTPTGYLPCDGSEVSRTTYVALFNIVGTYYGEGNGTTTFNVPNLTNDCNAAILYIIKT